MISIVNLLLKLVKFAFVFPLFYLGAYSPSTFADYVTMTPTNSTTGDLEVKITPYTGGCSAPPGGVCLSKWTSLQITHNNQTPSGHVFTNLGNNTYTLKVTKPGNWTVRYKLHKLIGEEPYPCNGDPNLLNTAASGTRAGDTCYFVKRTEVSTLGSDTSIVENPIGKPSFTTLPTAQEAADGDYTLSWNNPGGTTEFHLEEKDGANGTYQRITLPSKTSRSYTPPIKPQGHTYYYRIEACNNLQCSGFNSPAAVTVRTNEPPTVEWIESPDGQVFRPDNLPTLYVKATDSDGIQDVHFYRDNGFGDGKFLIGKAEEDNNKCTDCFRGNWTSSPLSPTIKVWAEVKDKLNAVKESVKVDVSVLANQAPTGWLLPTPSSVDQYGAVVLRAEASDSDGTVKSVEFLVNGTSLDVILTEPYAMIWVADIVGDNHQLEVIITDNEGLSRLSNAVSITVNALEPPDPPTGLTIDGQLQPIPDNTTGEYFLDWAVTPSWTTYKLEQLRVGIDTEFLPVALAEDFYPGHYFFNQPAGRYRYRVYACNKAGCSDPSAEIALNVVKEAPVSPVGLTATPDPDAESFTGRYLLQWDPLEIAPWSVHFVVQEKIGGPEVPGEWVTLDHNDSGTSFPIGLKSPGTYSYRVMACNALDCSEPGELITVTVLPPRILAAALSCDGACISLSGQGFDPNLTLTLSAVHNPALQQSFAAGGLTWRSPTEVDVPIPPGSALGDALYELGVRATITNPNDARGGITVYGDRATEIIGESQSAPALASDGTLYVGAGENLYALDAGDGSIKPAWPFTAGGIIKASPRVDGVDGTVYVGSLDHSLYAVTPDAVQKWRLETGGEIVSSVTLDEERVLYFGSMDGVLYAVNAPNGSVKWTFPANGGIAKAPVLAGNHTLYFTTVTSNQVYAIPRGNEGPGKQVWESVDDSLIWEEIDDWQPDPSQKSQFLTVARLYRGLLQPPLPFSKKILTFWTYQLIGGRTNAVEMAQAFLESDTGRVNFPTIQSDEQFLDTLYARMFPDQGQPPLTWGGVSYSSNMLFDMLEGGYSRAHIAVLFAQSLEYTDATSALLGHGFEYLYDQDYSWAVTECDEGEEYTRDCDADGLPDWWEILYFGDTHYDGSADPDGDGITNEEAFRGKLSPCAAGCNNGIAEEPPAPAAAPQIAPGELRASVVTGSLPGEFRVNELGAASYRIPLSLPAGSGGVAPELALSYSSQGGNGLLGQGWNLSGLSAISRCRKTLGQDGENAPIAWNAEDRFCLDGQRLILVEGSYGESGSEYRTEVDGYLLVTAHDSADGEPGYFTVERKDGSISEYGRSPKSRQVVQNGRVLTWAVSRYEDSAGNGIDFVYADEGGHRIRKINYAYGRSASPGVSVSFEYDGRTDVIRGYLSGALLSTNRRMAAIVVETGSGTVLRRYEMDYLDTGYDYLSRIARVRECAGGECRPDTVFEWRLPAINFTPSYSESVQLSSQRDRTAISPRPADINGDGRLDLIWLEPEWDDDGRIHEQFFKFVLATDTGFGPETLAHFDSARMRNPYRWEMLDYNADGRADLAIYLKGEGIWKIFPAGINSASDDWFIAYGGYETPLTDENVRFVDIDGDGLVDAVTDTGFHLLKRDPDALINSGEPFHFSAEHAWQIEGLESWGTLDEVWESTVRYLDPRAAGDFNGDGLVDLVLLDTKQVWEGRVDPIGFELKEQHTRAYIVTVHGDRLIAREKLLDFIQEDGFEGKNRDLDATPYDRHTDLKQKVQAVDVNSDGLADAVLFNEDHYSYRLNTGAGFDNAVGLGDFPEDALLQWFDYEGDGDVDLLWRDDSASPEKLVFRRWQSHQNAFSGVEDFKIVSSARNGGQDIFVDMNGDGVTDYLEFHDDHLYIYHSPDRKVAPNVIETITNGLGSVTRVAYGSTVSSGHYAKLGIRSEEDCWQDEDAGSYSASTENWCQQYHAEDVHGFYTALNTDWSGNHTLKKTSPTLEMLGTRFLVTRVESSAPAANDQPGFVNHAAQSAVSYFYGRAMLQAGGRGHLGFHRIRTVDEQSGVETTTTYRQDFPFLGSPLRTEVRTQAGHLLSEADNTWALNGWQPSWPQTAKSAGSVALGPLRPYLAESVEKTYELAEDGQAQGQPLTTVTSTTEQDTHGNTTHLTITTVAANGDRFEVDTENDFGEGQSVAFQHPQHGFNGYPELGRLVSTKVTHSRTEGIHSDSAVRESRFVYNDSGYEAGLLKEEIVEPDATDPVNGALRLKTRYEYDHFGNKTLAEQTAANEEPRSQRWVYDITGRFVEREENSYGQTTHKVLERNDYGQPTRVENMAGVESLFAYDAFGRQFLEYSATGAHHVTLFAPAGAECPAAAVYQVTERRGGGSEAVSCFDLLARSVRKASRGFDGSWNYVDTEYDALSRVKHQSEPYQAGSTRYWKTQDYDRTGRLVGTDLPGIASANGTGFDITVAYDGYTTVTTNPKGQVHRETANAVGEKVRVQDNLGNVQEFRHDAQGNLRFVTNKGDGSRNLVTEVRYDLRGRKIWMSDPDKGTWHYKHNGFGDLIKQTDAKGQAISNSYDQLGRLEERFAIDRVDGLYIHNIASWGYNNTLTADALGTPPGALREVVGPSYHIKLYTYDDYARPDETITSIGEEGDTHYEKTNYDEYSRPFQVFDAGGDGTWASSAIQHEYNPYGYLEQVIDAEQINLASGEQFYTVLEMDARGNVTRYLNGNGVTTEKTYDPATGRLLAQRAHVLETGNLQDLTYHWDDVGNLAYREDRSGGKDLHEDFEYDGLNRLTRSQVQGREAEEVRYDDLGNITYKTGEGEYRYGSDCEVAAGPHAVCESYGVSYEYDANGNMVTSFELGTRLEISIIKYNTFNQASEIYRAGNRIRFQYGPDGSRYLRRDGSGSNATETLYIGNVEKITRNGATEIKRYLPGGALVTISGGQRESRYLHKDHLGSLDIITDHTGAIAKDTTGQEQLFSFDAWGQRRNALDWSKLLNGQLFNFNTSITTRGFTGHEMLDRVGLIHMNGRIYNPALGRFLQADPFVQEPGYSQSYNRYAYVWNNPLNATDPSGYFRLREFVGTIVTIAVSIYCQACGPVVAGMIGGAAGAAANGGNIVQGAFWGAVSAAAFNAVGTAFEGAPVGDFAGSGLTPEAFAGKVLAHGLTGGVMSVLQGGKFGHGFASAGVTQAFSGAINGIGKRGNYGSATNRAYRIAAAAAVGGTASKLSGGKFANGAMTGAFSRAFNDELHDAFKTPAPLTFDDIFDADVGLGVSGGGVSLDLEGGAPSVDLNALGETLIPVSIDGSQIKIGKSLGLRNRAEIEAFGVLKTDGVIGVGGQASLQGATVEVQATANVSKPYEWFLKAVPAWLVRSVETVDVRAE